MSENNTINEELRQSPFLDPNELPGSGSDSPTVAGSPANAFGILPSALPRYIPDVHHPRGRTLVLCFDGTGDQ